MPVTHCTCCGGNEFEQLEILWPELVAEWELSPAEAGYIDRQQGYRCTSCGSNLRTMALAAAVMAFRGYEGVFTGFVEAQAGITVLEVNEAGQLTQFLRALPGHTFATFPEVDLQDLPFPASSFDLVVHSDTLEHVPDPVLGLSECRRVTKDSGATIFTVPIVIGRMTRTRTGLPASHHGSSAEPIYLVHTEYGSDTWCQVLDAGFTECRITSVDYPAGLALTALG